MARILIIGGGVAGLSAGIHAQKNGHKTIICEKHHVVGGNLTGWQRGEFHIDNCIHWLTGTNPNSDLYERWQEIGAFSDTDVLQGESLYTVEVNGERLSMHNDINKLEKRMLEIAPQDKKEIKSFIKAVKNFAYFTGTGGKNFNQKSTVFHKLKSFPMLYSYYNMTTGELANRFTHPLLREFFVALLGKDFGALAFLCTASTFCFNNGGIPQGGSKAMAQRIANRFKETGGELLLGKELIKITVENGTATSALFSDGSKICADYVVYTGDLASVFDSILPIRMPQNLKHCYENERLIRFSAVQTAFACDTDNLPFSADFIFELPQKHRSIIKSKRLIIREFTHDKSFAPRGKTVLQSLTFCSEDTAKRLIELNKKDNDAYLTEKEEFAKAVLDAITEKFPELSGKLHLLDVWTPATYKRYTNAEIGSFMSFAFSSKVIPSALSNMVKGVDNLILASQWLQAPGGLPIALNNGKHAINTIEKLEKRATKTQAVNHYITKRKRINER
jgi:phytoene dehydrogenase-like protein